MQTISDTISHLHLGEPTAFAGLTVFPLLGDHVREKDYLTLDEALEQEQARVIEVSEEGDVPNLLFENLGNSKVLLVDGDELVGAKQNRIINLTILVPAHTKIEIPVSCVEAGRWSYRSREFSSAKRSMYSRARAAKAEQVTVRMKVSGDHYSDQSAVWEDIAELSSHMDVSSPTGSMSDLYDQHEDRLDGYRKAFQAQEQQLGAVFAVNGLIHGLEYFDSPRPFAQYLDKLVGSYAVEAMSHADEDDKTVSSKAMTKFLESIGSLEGEAYPALGEGEDLRLSSPSIAGGALVADARVVHLAAFNLGATGQGPAMRSYHGRPVH